MSRQSRIAAQKRNEFRQLQQVNRLYAQKLQQGMTPAQAATSQGTQQVTLTDGQTLDALAAKNGVGVTDILNANPDMTAPKTGMVINIPNNYNPAQRGRGFEFAPGRTKDDTFGLGLPSNAALGGLTNNAVNQAPNNYNTAQRGRGFGQPAPQTAINNFGMTTLGSNPFSFTPQTSTTRPPTGSAVYVPPGLSPSQQAAAQTAIQTGQVGISAPAIRQTQANSAFAPTFRTKDDYYPTELAARVNLLGLTPSQDQLNYLEKYGMITKTPTPAYASGYGRNRRRRGRGGGGGGGTTQVKPPKATQAPSLPAFSSGAGFNGLVNWRI